ncbi:uncharacterized protein LOC114741903 isoform X2 [Neltuma alba]|nr:uncharacterized protein LOC114729685 isoform X2 [Prosopis alba]XP_028785990.1 uncharacterized protein LOC114741903 isoform X2 [Prosopis alba]
MKNLRPPQVPTISPNVLNQSGDFKLPPNHVQDPSCKRCLSTEEWTDEKHSMYLKSMEASFVHQLYNSKQVLAWRSPKATLTHSIPTTSTQWKDGGDGYWKKMEYEREKGQIRRRNKGHDLKAKPWIQQLSCSSGSVGKESTTSTATSKGGGLGQRNQIPSASPHHLLFFSDIEMTDQNFVDDEVVESEKKNVKRHKPLISDTSMHQC